jgi:hypothetical protein
LWCRIKRPIKTGKVDTQPGIFLPIGKRFSDCRVRGISLQVAVARRHAIVRTHLLKKNFNFFEMSGLKSFRKGKANQINLDTNMNIVADDRISEARGFTNQFVLFPTAFGGENWGQTLGSRLSREQMDAFLNAERNNARSAHFFTPPTEPPPPVPEKGLAAGVLKQAAYDLRRFRSASKGAKRELYLDAYAWITAHDFSWPYSFMNVCKLLDVCPEVTRAELLSDASLGRLEYWIRRGGRLSRRLRISFVRVFASCRNPEGAESSQLAPCV